MKIVRTHYYSRRAAKIFSAQELEKVDAMLLENPMIGVLIPGTNGARKVRVAAKGQGKRGGARIIYYFWQEGGAIYLFTAYAKNQQSDLLPKDKKDLARVISAIQRGGAYEH